jgi:hypothetical protein
MHQRIVYGAIALVFLIAVLTLLGWQLDIAVLKHGFSGVTGTMKPNTAIGLLIAAIVLGLLQSELKTQNLAVKNRLKFAIYLLSSGICLLGLLTLSEYHLGWNLGIDEWLFRDPESQLLGHPAGRMGQGAALNFFLTGLAFSLLTHSTRNSIKLAQLVGYLMLLIALLPLVAYAFGVGESYQPMTDMLATVPHASIAFILLGAGTLLTQPYSGLMQVVMGSLISSMMARRLLLLAVILPFLINWFALTGEQYGWYTPSFGHALQSEMMTFALSLLVWWVVRPLNRIERDRLQAEQKAQQLGDELQCSYRRLITTLESATDGFLALDQEWRFTYINQRAERILQQSRTVLLGHNIWEVFTEGFHSVFDEEFHLAMKRQMAVEFEAYYSPLRIWLAIHAVPSEDGLAVYLRNISDLKQGEEQLIELNNSLEQRVRDRTAELEHVNQQLQQKLLEHQQTEAALQVSQARFAGILEIASDAIIASDANQQIILFNHGAERIFGYTAQEILGQPLSLLFPERFRQRHQQYIQNYAHSGSGAGRMGERGGIWGRCKDGREFPAEASISKLETDGETVFTTILRDISDRKRLELALQTSENKLRDILNSPIAAIARLRVFPDQTWELDYLSAGCETVFGYTSQEFLDNPSLWMTKIHPEDLETVVLPRFREIFAERTVTYEYRFHHKDGRLRWLSGRFVSQQDAAAGCWYVNQLTVDITDRKQADLALRQSEARFHAFMDNCPASAWITNAEGQVLYLSQTYFRSFQLATNDAIGKSLFELFPTQVAQQFLNNVQTVITTGQVLEAIEVAPRLDGTRGEFLVYKFPLLDVPGRSLIGGFAVDVTERNRAEKALELQAVITRNMAEGICLVRTDNGVIVYTNPKFDQMFGYASGELLGQHISIVNYLDEHSDSEEIYRQLMQAVINHGEISYEIQNVKKNGILFWCGVTTSVFEHSEYGTVLVSVQQDITVQKQSEELVRASLREKEVLLKEIHHRVKNNLQIVDSLLQMQSRRTKDQKITSILWDSCNRIKSIALVHEKLYGSENLADIHFSSYILDLTAHLFESYTISSGCVNLDTHVEDIYLDIETAIPCGLIINELVSNALKYAFPNNREGVIQVEFYSNPDRSLTLSVRDNGIGIPADFDLAQSPSLGLVLVQNLVEQLDATLELKRGSGTEFRIILPAT